MAERVQAALRKDPLVQAAVHAASASMPAARGVLVWNGDWVASPGQEGRGLAAAREAILWAVGFAPEGCRNEVQQGLVVFSFHEGQETLRLAVGQPGSWRWSGIIRPVVGAR